MQTHQLPCRTQTVCFCRNTIYKITRPGKRTFKKQQIIRVQAQKRENKTYIIK